MTKNLLDTNLIIRFLVNDDPQKSAKVEGLLNNPRNHNLLPDMVIAEIIWVLSSYYELPKSEILEKIRALITVRSVRYHKTLINQSLDLWERYNLSFIDCYLAALAISKDLTFYSYDQRLKQVSSLPTHQP